MTGRISRIAYKPGLFFNADLDKASEDNERNGLVIDSPLGRFGVVQIAGLVARRIVSFVQEGQSLGVGERFGLIRFGSRVDVYLPPGARVLVGDRLQGRGGRNRARGLPGRRVRTSFQGRMRWRTNCRHPFPAPRRRPSARAGFADCRCASSCPMW